MSKRTLNFDNFMMEKKEDPIEVTVFGEVYRVKPEIPAIVPVMMARSNDELSDSDASRMVLRAGDIMFGRENIEKFCEKGMSVNDLGMLIRKVFDTINGTSLDDDDTETLTDDDGVVPANKKPKK